MAMIETTKHAAAGEATIFVVCPDDRDPCGGVKQLYRHVDVLNDLGFSATIVHSQRGFRCTWFKNETRLSYAPDIKPSMADYLVIPETFAVQSLSAFNGIRKVIFNQGCYLTFGRDAVRALQAPVDYRIPDVRAVLVVSEDSRRYITFAFPTTTVLKLQYGFDFDLFYPVQPKKRQIAVMPRRRQEDIAQVMSILKSRGTLRGFECVFIDKMSEAEVAQTLRDSLIFLSFSSQEGFGMPPAEAMACGCVVVGYHGGGGREFFRPEFSHPIPDSEIIAFVEAIETVLETFDRDPAALYQQGELAAAYIREKYSLGQETASIRACWAAIFALG